MEKQTLNVIKQIYKFNQQCKNSDGQCLLDQGYNDKRESAYNIEEMLEGFSNLQALADKLNSDASPKNLSRSIISIVSNEDNKTCITDVDRLDKHIDSIIYNFGSIFKLGLTAQEAMKAIAIVCDANTQKIKNTIIDDNGKVCKHKDFIPPEESLQMLLNKIKKDNVQ